MSLTLWEGASATTDVMLCLDLTVVTVTGDCDDALLISIVADVDRCCRRVDTVTVVAGPYGRWRCANIRYFVFPRTTTDICTR